MTDQTPEEYEAEETKTNTIGCLCGGLFIGFIFYALSLSCNISLQDWNDSLTRTWAMLSSGTMSKDCRFIYKNHCYSNSEEVYDATVWDGSQKDPEMLAYLKKSGYKPK